MDDRQGGGNEVQRTMLEIVNQLDGFNARGNIKVCIWPCSPQSPPPPACPPFAYQHHSGAHGHQPPGYARPRAAAPRPHGPQSRVWPARSRRQGPFIYSTFTPAPSIARRTSALSCLRAFAPTPPAPKSAPCAPKQACSRFARGARRYLKRTVIGPHRGDKPGGQGASQVLCHSKVYGVQLSVPLQ